MIHIIITILYNNTNKHTQTHTNSNKLIPRLVPQHPLPHDALAVALLDDEA